nr:MAG TPA: hypothetical protein [Caudoviricetes sp.]
MIKIFKTTQRKIINKMAIIPIKKYLVLRG